MKKITTLLLTLLLSISVGLAQEPVFTSAKILNAEAVMTVENSTNDTDYYRLGYCEYDFDPNNGVGLQSQNATTTAFIEFKSSYLEKYVGSYIHGVRVGFTKPVSNFSALVRNSLTGDNIVSKPATVSGGWNTVLFDEPIEIEADKDYYIGYKTDIRAGAFELAMTPTDAVTSGAFLLQLNQDAFSDYTSQFGSLAIQALLQGDSEHFLNKGELVGMSVSSFISLADKDNIEPEISILNQGLNEINEVEIEVKYADKDAVTQEFELSLPANSVAEVNFTGIEFDTDGELKVTLTKLNGNLYEGNTLTQNIEVYNPEHAAERKVLLEQFTTEQCVNCPLAKTWLENVLALPEYKDKVIWVAHHAGYYTDPYTIPASSSYLRFYGPNGTFAPAMMVDRTVFSDFGVYPVNGIGDEAYLKEYFNQAMEVISFVTVNIDQDNDMHNNKVSITVSGKWGGELPADDMYVNVFLLEDDISSRNQSGALNTNYIHNGTIRAALGGTSGTKIVWNGNDYSVTVDGTLKSTWKTENMNVVAFVAKRYLNALDNVQVMNAEQATLDISTDVEYNSYADKLKVYVKDRTIVVDGEYKSLNVYDIKGAELNNSMLSDGLYIVKVSNGDQKAIRKVIVQ